MSESRPRGRPPKFPPSDVRDRLVESGIRSLQESGLEIGLDAVALDAAIIDAEVPRGMAYRIWKDSDLSPQNALRQAVVLKLLSLPATTGLAATREMLATALEEHNVIDLRDSADRERVAIELIRSVGGFNHQALDESPEWRLYNALRASAMTRQDEDSSQVIDLLRDGENLIIDEYSKLYAELSEALGIELRDGYTIEQFSAAAYALNEGLAARLSTRYEGREIKRLGKDGTDEEWTLFSIGLEGLIRQFFIL